MKFIPVNSYLGAFGPNKIWLGRYLGERGIAYTGSDHKAHKLELNKHLAKQRVLDAGFETAPYCVFKQGQIPIVRGVTLTYPLFVKPTNRGGGSGIDSNSIVHNFGELKSKVESIATDLQSDSLIEEYLEGREFSVAILKKEYSPRFSVMPIELITPPDKNGERFLGNEAKSSNVEQAIKVRDGVIKSKVSELALNIFRSLGGQDYGRIDIRLDKYNVPQFLEANLIPSLISGYGSFPKACMLNAGLDYEHMILHITQLGLARSTNSIEPNFESSTTTGAFSSLGTA